MTSEIHDYFVRHRQVLELAEQELAPAIATCITLLDETLRRGNKLLIAGNGGSAADAQHFAAELVGRFLAERRALPAIALTTDTSILTAIGNDYGFERIFCRQIEALAQPGDVFFGISTSGNSPNILHAVRTANQSGCKTIGLLGRDGGVIGQEVGLSLVVTAKDTPHVQETHLTIIHLLCKLLEKRITT